MSWWEPNSKLFCCYPAKRSFHANTLVGPLHKNFLPIFCKGNTSRHAMVGPQHKSFSQIFYINNTYRHALMGPQHKMLSPIFHSIYTYPYALTGPQHKSFCQVSARIILIDMHWWVLNTKSYRRFSTVFTLNPMH